MVYMSELVEHDDDDYPDSHIDHKAACMKEKKDLETPSPIDKFDIHIPLSKHVSTSKSPKNSAKPRKPPATLARPRKIDHRAKVY